MKSTGEIRFSRLSPLLLVLPFLDDLVLQCQQVLLVEILGVVYKQIVPLVALVEDEIHNLEKCTANRQQTRVELLTSEYECQSHEINFGGIGMIQMSNVVVARFSLKNYRGTSRGFF